MKNHFLRILLIGFTLAGCSAAMAQPLASFKPGQIWQDTDGVHINAHGGGILLHKGVYYWFGEHKSERTSSALVGVTCYSSTDLYTWKNQGAVLSVSSDPESEIVSGCVIERPKVAFNKATGKFVMYFHLELKGKGYSAARTGIAVADNITGPYTFIRSLRPNAGKWPENMSEEQKNAVALPSDFDGDRAPGFARAVADGLYVRRDFKGGQMARDMTVFVDDNGKAYHIYSSEENYTLHAAELSSDYLDYTGRYVRIAPGGHNEAPAVFKKDGVYYMITSGCTGWDPNEARMFTAPDIFGPWTQHPNPCRGVGRELTFRGQSTFVLPGKTPGSFIFMADRWTPRRPVDARYIWLPIRFEAGLPVIEWKNEWNLGAFNSMEEPDEVKINHDWGFLLGDDVNAKQKSYPAGKMQPVTIPHDWSAGLPMSASLSSATGYLPGGVGWYRREIFVPENRRGQRVFLFFEGIYNRSEVFVNGHSAGGRPSGYASFEIDITDRVEYGSTNLVAVRVDRSRYNDSRWYPGSGIYRDVWLRYAGPARLNRWGGYAYAADISAERGTLRVETTIDYDNPESLQGLAIVNELVSPDNKTVGRSNRKVAGSTGANGSITVTADIKVNKPELWGVDSPRLYTLITTVSKGNKVIERRTVSTGFRSIKFDPDRGFFLNGTNMKLKGVCIHHDGGVFGAAVGKAVWERRLLTLKRLGCNAIRCSHNPHATYIYELCDKLGLLVMDEAFDEWEMPKRKWVEGWNAGVPTYDGIVDFFAEWSERDLADMVRRDRNHISIFAWSIGNEIDYPNDPYSHPILDGSGRDGFTQPIFGGYRKDAPNAERLGDIAQRLVAVAKQYDKSRPVTAALAGVAMSNQTKYPASLDIAGYNYTESMYSADHAAYPQRVIYGSENGHGIDAWRAVADNDYIAGQFLWTGVDYLGESGRWPSRGSTAGLIDLAGHVKPRGEFRRSLWTSDPMIYIGTYPVPNVRPGQNRRPLLSTDAMPVWNYSGEELIRVVCYTNAAKARLELNGRIVGEEEQYDPTVGIIHWDVPYSPGSLVAIALDAGGRETARYAIKTSKRPHALRLLSDEKTGSLRHLTIEVVDEDGLRVRISDNEVTCTVSGPARLLGLESANSRDAGNHTDNVERVHNGQITAYIEEEEDGEGKALISFTSPWLKGIEI
jgi:hypothetical protein